MKAYLVVKMNFHYRQLSVNNSLGIHMQQHSYFLPSYILLILTASHSKNLFKMTEVGDALLVHFVCMMSQINAMHPFLQEST